MFDTTVIEAHELGIDLDIGMVWGVIWGEDDIRWRCARVNDMVLEEGQDEPNVH